MRNKLVFLNIIAIVFILGGCKASQDISVFTQSENTVSESRIWAPDSAEKMDELVIEYADTFHIDCYENDMYLITIHDTDKYLFVSDADNVPEVADDITVIAGVQDNIYVASSSDMDFFNCLDAMDSVCFTSTKQENWSIDAVAERLSDGRLEYVGKYNMPDYERLVDSPCRLAIENTMVYHCPEVKENLESLGINVLVDYSSYESTPLGRLEYVKLYGLLCGKYDEAKAFFDESIREINDISFESDTSVSVGYYYIASGGHINIRKPGDYVTRMIELAGGHYAFDGSVPEEENALATMNIQLEVFYEMASKADILIYNNTTTGDVHSIADLINKEPVMASLPAVADGNIWSTSDDMFQRTTAVAEVIGEFNRIINGTADDEMKFFYRLK